MNRAFLLQHATLFACLTAVIALVLSAYGHDDLRKILRASARRFAVFTVGVALLGVAMALFGKVVLAVE